MKDLPPTKEDETTTKKHTQMSIKYNLEPHAIDHLKGVDKNLKRLSMYDAEKAKKLAKYSVKKLTPVINSIKASTGVASNLKSAQVASKS